MRISITLADDVAAAVDDARRARSIGLDEAINELVRIGLSRARSHFVQQTYELGDALDYTNVAETVDALDRRAAR